MPQVLDIDGKKFEQPDGETIVRELNSIGGGGISLVILERDQNSSIYTSGLPSEGWMSLFNVIEGKIYCADISAPLSQEKIIQIFQSYARGEEEWKKEFKWELFDDGKRSIKWFGMLAAVLLIIVFFICKFSK